MTDDLVKRLRAHSHWGMTGEAADRIEALTADNARLREALTALVDEYCDYMTINHLGDPERQHNIKRARAALNTGKETVAGARALDCVCGMGFGPCKDPECKAPILAQKGDSHE